jgi:ABC-type polysaccharide/polyol phosphate transport system ATPase subunit
MTVGRQSDRPLIEVKNASKSFVLRREQSRDLREGLSLARLKQRFSSGMEEFWAVKDVSFEVRPGQSVGIVGHNGSGKSTMLKMLTGILKPNRGVVAVRGRVGALIEVGAGFHPDLSGRENIFLNGSILGLSRREVASRFDEIVSFAGLERFIDTPVKRYSSGMYMRLGFSIAIHTEPDILLIDEVLAVGDALFQRKCLRRLEKFVADGGAAVFVSHAMAQVADLCKTCVWLDHGEALYIGDTELAIDKYLALVEEREDVEFKRNHPEEWAALQEERRLRDDELKAIEEEERRQREEAERAEAERLREQRALRQADVEAGRVLGVTLRDARGIARTTVQAGERIRLEIHYRFGPEFTDPIVGVDFIRSDGLHMFTTSNYDHKASFKDLPISGTLTVDIAALNLNVGTYRVQINLFANCEGEDWWRVPADQMEEAVSFTVQSQLSPGGCAFFETAWNDPDTIADGVRDDTDRSARSPRSASSLRDARPPAASGTREPVASSARERERF